MILPHPAGMQMRVEVSGSRPSRLQGMTMTFINAKTRIRATTRRQFLELGAASALTFVALAKLGPDAAFAQADPTNAQLMADNALPDIWQGSADAKVTIIEYASMTCPHCAHFHEETMPVLKSKYIDTGKVRFTLREFPFDPLATAAFMLARCAGDKRDAMIDLFFAQQKNWAFTNTPLQGLVNLAKQAGMSQETFDACLKDQKLYDNVNQVRDRGAKTFNVDATPTFFINGKKTSGALSPDELDKALEPLLKS
jgi:protein-disulfide isomerase